MKEHYRVYYHLTPLDTMNSLELCGHKMLKKKTYSHSKKYNQAKGYSVSWNILK